MRKTDPKSITTNLEFEEPLFPRFLLLCASMAVATTYLMLFKNAFHGLDISDEGMYLLSVHNVSDKMSFHNPFGDYTGLLFKLSLEKVWLFRISGYLVLGSAGAYLGTATAKTLTFGHSKIFTWSIVLSGLLIVPFYYALGILTPSYNWLNLLSLCVGLGAILNVHSFQQSHDFKIWLNLIFLSLSIWVGTFAKLSTGVGIFLIFLVASALRRRPLVLILRQTGGIFGFLISFAILHHLFISPLGTSIEKISRGLKALEVLDPKYSFALSFDSFKRGSIEWLFALIGEGFIWPISVAVILLFVLRYRNKIEAKYRRFTWILLIPSIFSGLFSEVNGIWTGVSGHYNEQMWAATNLLSVSIFTVLVIYCLDQRFAFSTLLWIGALLGIPVLYAFGSNNGFVMQITGATGVIGLVSILLLSSSERLGGSHVATMCLILSIGGLSTTISSSRAPYRQAPLAEQTVQIEITPQGGRLYVDQDFANDINSLRLQLKSNGWKSRTPLLDFTQYSAGIVYALDAQQPITIIPTAGGSGGVNALAEWSLSYIAKNDVDGIWQAAWLLLPSELNSNSCLSCPNVSALQILGRNYPSEYQLVASSKNFRIYKPRN